MPAKEWPDFELPNGEATTLWRYMDLAKFTWMLLNSRLYLPRSDRLGDPFEGSMSATALRLQRNEIERQFTETLENSGHGVAPSEIPKERLIHDSDTSFRNSYRVARYCWYVSCWHISEHESAALWKLYGLGDQSIAIRTTADKLCSVFDDAPIAEVKYIDYRTDGWPPFSILTPLLHKQNSYAHEREARVLVHHIEPGVADVTKNPPGIEVPVSSDELIEEIRVCPTASDLFLSVVRDLTTQFEVAAPIRRSDLSRDPLW